MNNITLKVHLPHRFFTPLRFFLNDSRASGVILLTCTFVSLTLANSSISEWYRNIWLGPIGPNLSPHLPGNFIHWINDLLMAVFFLLAGMEIKRELVGGELASFQKAILPFGAAFGGMLAPALIFTFINVGSSYSHGWGIPTATDIAFSLGIASLFSKRVPVSLKILLMALAIIDDLGAIVVIALFYGGKMNWLFLEISAVIYLMLWACNYFKIKFGIVQLLLAGSLWYTILNSGIEASITGVLVAFALPVNVLPMIEKRIHGLVNFLIIPLFALANTAILLPSNITQALDSSVALGVVLGLVIGKPVGIFLITRLLVACKIAKLPGHVDWKQIIGMGTLAGIGFTMSIFTTTLAFKDEATRDIAKIAILVSVGASLVISWIYFSLTGRKFITKPARERSIPDIAIG
jgi:NhaA family Na+:H+ antiporter